MKGQSDSKVSQLNTPYARQVSNQKTYNRHVHKRRCQRIIAVFLVMFLIFGIQIFQSKRTLADINGNIRQAQSQLTKNKRINNYNVRLKCCIIPNIFSRLSVLSIITLRRAR